MGRSYKHSQDLLRRFVVCMKSFPNLGGKQDNNGFRIKKILSLVGQAFLFNSDRIHR